MIGGLEWIIIFVIVAIILLRPKSIKELARAFGSAMGEFKKGLREAEEVSEEVKRRKKKKE